jgi:uncharacterized protein (DUF362 family)/ferredoxin
MPSNTMDMRFETYQFSRTDVHSATCKGLAAIAQAVEKIISETQHLLPHSKDALILIKPNFHKDLCSLMSNTTDFRVIGATIQALKRRGYFNITIGEGPACGFSRMDIDVFKRLRVDRLARYYDVSLLNFNHTEAVEVALTRNVRARVAKICLDADMFINMPKLKTHLLAGISAASKHLVGCLKGMDKRKMHTCLSANIVRLNEIIRPDLHIVDGLIAMEGQGPGVGTPIRMNRLIAGTDPYLVDLVCATLAGHDRRKIEYLAEALRRRKLSSKDLELASGIAPVAILKQARPNLIVRITTLRHLIWLRDLLRPVYDIPSIAWILYRLKIREDVFDRLDDQAVVTGRHPDRCNGCKRCLEFCPLGLPILDEDFDFGKSDCINCLYCFFACPHDAVSIEGRLGYLSYLIRDYKDKIKHV